MNKNGVDVIKLTKLMIEWGDKKSELDALEENIKEMVFAIGETQTVGNVRASYKDVKRTFDYQKFAVDNNIPEETLLKFTSSATDWRKAVLDWNPKINYDDLPVSNITPAKVSISLLE